MIRTCFDGGWTFTRDQVHVERNTAKSGSCGVAANLTLDEGGESPIPASLAAKLSPELMEQLLTGFRTVAGDWMPVTLPDDWTTRIPPVTPPNTTVRMEKAAADPNVRMGFLPTGVAWYRKVFDVPAEYDGQRVSIEFDGVMRDAHVWVNGCFIGSHYSGYTGFALDLTEHLRYGEEGHNVVLVRTDTTSQEGWWAEGGGIYRHVWLVVRPQVHIARHGVFVRTHSLTAHRAELVVRSEVVNDTARRAVARVHHSLGGEPVAVTVEPLGSAVCEQRLVVERPRVWSLDDPQLYELVTTVVGEEGSADEVGTTFGIRTVEYGSEGLLLNGVLTPINGVCVHHDFAGVGIALPDAVQEYKIRRLKEMGANAYRSAHHPASPDLLDACDRLGVMVLDENRRLESNPEGLVDLAEMIRGHRNHPSVFMWSLENEEMIDGTPMSRRILRRMVDVAHHHDPSRPTTIASMFGKHDGGYMAIADVAGFNYDRGDAARYREQFSGAPTMNTENVSYHSSRGIYMDDPDAGLTSSYDEGSFLERTTNKGGVVPDLGAIGGAVGTEGDRLAATEVNRMAHPYLGGVFVWTGFDYRGECAPWGWPQTNSTYGLMDYAGFPKDVAHYWRSRWTAQPVVHVFPHWNWPDLVGQPIRLVIYSNCDEVDVMVNGELQGRHTVPAFGIVETVATYAPGRLEVRGWRGAEVATSVVRETTGPAAGLRLRTDGVLDGVAVVSVDVVDAEGRVVPDACPPLEFGARDGAEVIGSGNGHTADQVPACSSARPAFNGHALAVVRAREGGATVSVSSPGLGGVELRLEP